MSPVDLGDPAYQAAPDPEHLARLHGPDATPTEKAYNISASFINALARTTSSLSKSISVAAKALANLFPDGWLAEQDKDVQELAFYKYGQALEDFVDKALPRDPKFRETFITKLAEGFGSTAGFVMSGAAGRVLKVPALLTVAGTGAAVGSTAEFEQAVAAGATEGQAMKAAAWGGLVGTSEALPVSRIFRRFDKASGGQFSMTAKRLLAEGFKGGFEEMVQEVFQGASGNVIAKNIYDNERKLLDGLVEGGGIGGIVGTTANIIATAAGARLRHGRKVRRTPTGKDVQAFIEDPSRKNAGKLGVPRRTRDSAKKRKEMVEQFKAAQVPGIVGPIAVTKPKGEPDALSEAKAETKAPTKTEAEKVRESVADVTKQTKMEFGTTKEVEVGEKKARQTEAERKIEAERKGGQQLIGEPPRRKGLKAAEDAVIEQLGAAVEPDLFGPGQFGAEIGGTAGVSFVKGEPSEALAKAVGEEILRKTGWKKLPPGLVHTSKTSDVEDVLSDIKDQGYADPESTLADIIISNRESGSRAATLRNIADLPEEYMTPEGRKALRELRRARETAASGGQSAGFPAAGGLNVDFPMTEGEARGALRVPLKPVPMPELVSMAKELMGQFPRIKRLRKNLGLFRGVGAGDIIIDPKVAKDPVQLAMVLAHEIGHLIDYTGLPKTLARGNLLGRLHTLRKFLRNSFGDAGPTNKEMRQELIGLTQWWHPYDPTTASKKYRKLRESSRELYADALSVFLNTPGELQNRAPQFYAQLTEHLNTKPDVVQAYLGIQDVLSGTPERLAEVRRQNIQEMFTKGDEAVLAAAESRRAAQQSTGETVRQFLGQFILDRTKPAKHAVLRGREKGPQFDEAKNAEYLLDELFMIDNPGRVLIDKIDESIYRPLTEAGITKSDMGIFLFARRVVNERNEIANPLGFDPKASNELLSDLESRLGTEGFALLEAKMKAWHDLMFEVAEEAVRVGTYGQKVFDDTIAPNKDNYATFAIVKYIDEYVSPMIREQVGTFEDTANPWDRTILKMLSLQRLNQLIEAKNTLVGRMKETMPDDIREVAIPFGRSEPSGRAKPGKSFLRTLEDGKNKAYEVPANIAKSFDSQNLGELARYSNLLQSAVYKVFHPLYVTFSPGFLAANPFRDLRRTHKGMGAVGSRLYKRRVAELESEGVSPREAKRQANPQKVHLGEVLREFFKAIPAATRRARGLSDETISQMTEHKALAIPYTDVKAEITEPIIPARLPGEAKERTIDERLKESRILPIRGLGHLLQGMRILGEIQESATKVAAFRILGKRGVDPRERAFYVRKYAGTPDYKQQGQATSFTNSVWMYSKVRWNGYQAEASLAFAPDTAAAYWWRTMVWSIMPTTLTKMGLYGLLGASVKALLDNVPEYFLDNYDVIPLGTVDDDGEEKTVFLTIPKDDVGRMMSNIWSRAIDAAIEAAGGKTKQGSAEKAFADLFGQAYGEVVPNLNPILDMGSKWSQFALGQNPYDSYFGEPIVPRSEWEAGGWDATKKMLSWSVDKSGSLKTFAHVVTGPLLGGAFEEGTESTIETTVRSVPGLSRLLRISDRGRSEWDWSEIENEEQEKARARLSLPKSARRATLRRYFLSRKGDENLSAEERTERRSLGFWYSNTYLPMTKRINDLQEAGRDREADKLRKTLGSAASRAMSGPHVVTGRRKEPRTPRGMEDVANSMSHRLGAARPSGREKIRAWQDKQAEAIQWFTEQGFSMRQIRLEYRKYLRKRYKTSKTRRAYMRRFNRNARKIGR